MVKVSSSQGVPPQAILLVLDPAAPFEVWLRLSRKLGSGSKFQDAIATAPAVGTAVELWQNVHPPLSPVRHTTAMSRQGLPLHSTTLPRLLNANIHLAVFFVSLTAIGKEVWFCLLNHQRRSTLAQRIHDSLSGIETILLDYTSLKGNVLLRRPRAQRPAALAALSRRVDGPAR